MISGLPSKKIFFLIVACIVGVGAVGFAVYATKTGFMNGPGGSLFANSSDKNNTGSLESVVKSLKTRSGLDDDADGLLNWEESLWGTSLTNPDSDGDGTQDGEEVMTNRNPTKPGPGDTVNLNTDNTKQTEGNETTNKTLIPLENTETARVGRDLFSNYLQAKQAGLPLNTETTQKIIDAAIEQKLIGVPSKTYTLADININTGSDFKKYGNDLGFALSAGSTQSPVSEIEILQNALASENPNEIKKLDPIMAGYAATLQRLVSISVPKDAAVSHVALLNGISHVLGDIQSFRAMFEDPILGLVGVNGYFKDVNTLRSALSSIKSMFYVRGVTFQNGEYGYVFMQTI